MKILIVDDEAAIRQALATILRHGGYEVVTADDGSALETGANEVILKPFHADDLLSRVANALS